MTTIIQRNFFFIWILMLLGIAIALTLSLSGCSSVVKVNAPVESKATEVLNQAQPTQVQSSCSDSDSGIDPKVKGTVTAGEVKRTDTCLSPFLVEYYCDNGEIANKNIRCECSNGKCD